MVKKKTKRTPKAKEPPFDATTHVLVPEHTLCSDAERKTIVEKYNVVDQQFPRITISDPAIQHLGVKEGDLIKITRKSPTAGDTVFFRIVSTE